MRLRADDGLSRKIRNEMRKDRKLGRLIARATEAVTRDDNPREHERLMEEIDRLLTS